MPRVVFLTAFNEYAPCRLSIRNAFDYLLKPIDPPAWISPLKRLRTRPHPTLRVVRCGCATEAGLLPPPASAVDQGRRYRSTPLQNGWVYVTVSNGSEHFTELTLRTLEEKTSFLRCHRQYLVNQTRLANPAFEAGTVEIVTRNNHHVPVSRRLLG